MTVQPRSCPNLSTAELSRFWAKVDRSQGADACWPWTASGSRGYGRIGFGGHQYRAHRIAYELLVGPIPDGLVIDHLCRNRGCCNPAHMEPVTFAENILRGEAPSAINARMVRCVNGHEFTARSNGRRICRTCERERRVAA